MLLAQLFVAVALISLGATSVHAGPNAYVGNLSLDNVSVIDTATNAIIANISLGGPGGSWGVAVHPTGARVYIGWFNGVAAIDASTNSVTSNIGQGDAFGLAITPQGTRLYATDRVTFPYRVRVIDTANDTVVASIPFSFAPHGAAASPDGRYVYVTAGGGGKVWVLDTSSNTYATLPSLSLCTGGLSGFGITVSPDGGRVYVAMDDGALCVIDTHTGSPIARIPLSLWGGTMGVALHPSGSTVYVAGYATYVGPGQVSVVDTTTNRLIATTRVGNSAEGISVHPDGTRVYVTSRFPGSVTVLSTTSNSVIATIPIPGEPMALGNFIGPLPATTASTPIPVLSGAALAMIALLIGVTGSAKLRANARWDKRP